VTLRSSSIFSLRSLSIVEFKFSISLKHNPSFNFVLSFKALCFFSSTKSGSCSTCVSASTTTGGFLISLNHHFRVFVCKTFAFSRRAFRTSSKGVLSAEGRGLRRLLLPIETKFSNRKLRLSSTPE
jgi:hypothetical protein